MRGRLGVGVCSCLEGREKWSAWRSMIWGTNSVGTGRCPRDVLVQGARPLSETQTELL